MTSNRYLLSESQDNSQNLSLMEKTQPEGSPSFDPKELIDRCPKLTESNSDLSEISAHLTNENVALKSLDLKQIKKSLKIASISGRRDELELLQTKEINLATTIIDDYDSTFLHILSERGHLESIVWLHSVVSEDIWNSLVKCRDIDGRTPLHRACLNTKDNQEVITFLVWHGANVNEFNACRFTPLHFAARYNISNIKCLIQLGADLNLLNVKRMTPTLEALFKQDSGDTFIELKKIEFQKALGYQWEEIFRDLFPGLICMKKCTGEGNFEEAKTFFWSFIDEFNKAQMELEKTDIKLRKILIICLMHCSYFEQFRVNSIKPLPDHYAKLTSAAHYAASAMILAESHLPGFNESSFFYKQIRLQQELIESSYFHILQPFQPHTSYSFLSDVKKQINEFRLSLNDQLSSPTSDKFVLQTKNVASKITYFFSSLFRSMLQQSMEVLGECPSEYCVIGLGSMGRGEMCPYSDLEFAIILPQSDNEENNSQIEYFIRASEILQLRMIALGETNSKSSPIILNLKLKSGFSYDSGGNTPLTYADERGLIGSVQELIDIQNDENESREISQTALRYPKYIKGSKDLFNLYLESLRSNFGYDSQQFQKIKTIKDIEGRTLQIDEEIQVLTTLRNNRFLNSRKLQDGEKIEQKNKEKGVLEIILKRMSKSLEFIKGDLKCFKPRLAEEDVGGDIKSNFDVKAELYRLPNQMLLGLCHFLGYQVKNCFEAISKLYSENIITLDQSKRLEITFCQILKLRIKVQLFYSEEKEKMHHHKEGGDPCYILKDEEISELVGIYEVLLPLYQGMDLFSKDQSTFILDFQKDYLMNKADSYQRLQQFQDAEKCLEEFLAINPNNNMALALRINNSHQCKILIPAKKIQQYQDQAEELISDLISKAKNKANKETQFRLYSSYLNDQCKLRVAELIVKGQLKDEEVKMEEEKQVDPNTFENQRRKLIQALDEDCDAKEHFQKGNLSEKYGDNVGLPDQEVSEKQEIKVNMSKIATILKNYENAFNQYQSILMRTKDIKLVYLRITDLMCKISNSLRTSIKLQEKLQVIDVETLVQNIFNEENWQQHFVVQVYKTLPIDLRGHFINFVLKAKKQNSLEVPIFEELLKVLRTVPDEIGIRLSWLKKKENWTDKLQNLFDAEADGGVKLITNLKFSTGGITVFESNLKEDIAKQLIDEKGNFRENKIKGSVSNVIKVGNLYFKANPEMPGMTFLIEEIHERIAGHGTSSSLLACLEIKRTMHDRIRIPVLISEEVEGQNFQDVLMNDEENRFLQAIDHKSFSELFLAQVLTNPEDGKPNNFVLSEFKNEEKLTKFKLISVDHDHALFPPFMLNEQNQRELKVNTIVFCLPQMRELLDPEARMNFLGLKPDRVLKSILQQAQIQNENYQEIFRQKEITQYYQNGNVIPIPLKKGDTVQLYQKFVRMQQFLRHHSDATMIQILQHIEPGVGQVYQFGMEIIPDSNLLLRFSLVCQGYTQSDQGYMLTSTKAIQTIRILDSAINSVQYHNLSNLTPEQGLAELDLLQYDYSRIDEIRSDIYMGDFSSYESLAEWQAEVVFGDEKNYGIDFKQLPTEAQQMLLLSLVKKDLRYLRFNSYSGQPEILHQLLVDNKELIELSIQECDYFLEDLQLGYSFSSTLQIIKINFTEIQQFSGEFPFLLSLNLDNNKLLSRLLISAKRLEVLEVDHTSLEQIETQSENLNKLTINFTVSLDLSVLQSTAVYCQDSFMLECEGHNIYSVFPFISQLKISDVIALFAVTSLNFVERSLGFISQESIPDIVKYFPIFPEEHLLHSKFENVEDETDEIEPEANLREFLLQTQQAFMKQLMKSFSSTHLHKLHLNEYFRSFEIYIHSTYRYRTVFQMLEEEADIEEGIFNENEAMKEKILYYNLCFSSQILAIFFVARCKKEESMMNKSAREQDDGQKDTFNELLLYLLKSRMKELLHPFERPTLD